MLIGALVMLGICCALTALRTGRQRPEPVSLRAVAEPSMSEQIEITLSSDLLAGTLAPEHYRRALELLAEHEADVSVATLPESY